MKNRILHIDDDAAMLTIVASALSRDPSLETRSCPSGEQGVQTAADWLPDLILSDVTMPDLNGVEVLDRLRNNSVTAGIPVVFTTARGMPENVAEYLAQGAAGVIVKPFKLRELADKVRAYLDLVAAEPIEAGPPPEIRIGKRLKDDAAILAVLRTEFEGAGSPKDLRHVVHKLAGVAGIYGFASIGEAASVVEREIDRLERGTATRADVVVRLDELLGLLDRENQFHADL